MEGPQDQKLPGQSPRKMVKTEVSQLDQLKKFSLVVADTGDFNQLKKYKPEDSTTNPSLILQAAELPQFANLIDQSIKFGIANYSKYKVEQRGKKKVQHQEISWNQLSVQDKQGVIELIYDHLFVAFGCNILKEVPGYVSTEVDAKLSFDIDETVKRGKRIIKIYEQMGISSDRILIKVAATWQGIKAAEILAKSKIKCNLTLIFHKIQAIACAQTKLFLISPFVGRILDWSKKQYNKEYTSQNDPGVISVTQIFNFFKKFDYKTVIMGASFRNTGQIKQLAGCDRLTISPKLLSQLESGNSSVQKKLDEKKAKQMEIDHLHIDQKTFRYQMNNSKMATDLLSAGIRKFEEDGNKLKSILRKRVAQLYEKDVAV